MPITTYIVQELSEETECSQCGFPLYMGAKVYMPSETLEPACCTQCAQLLIDHYQESKITFME